MPTADAARGLLAAIAAVTPKPVTTVILTHSDADHVAGLTAFAPTVTVIAHEGAEREMEQPAPPPALPQARAAPANPRPRLPTQLIAHGRRSGHYGVKLQLRHWSAHTSGDLIVFCQIRHRIRRRRASVGIRRPGRSSGEAGIVGGLDHDDERAARAVGRAVRSRSRQSDERDVVQARLASVMESAINRGPGARGQDAERDSVDDGRRAGHNDAQRRRISGTDQESVSHVGTVESVGRTFFRPSLYSTDYTAYM